MVSGRMELQSHLILADFLCEGASFPKRTNPAGEPQIFISNECGVSHVSRLSDVVCVEE